MPRAKHVNPSCRRMSIGRRIKNGYKTLFVTEMTNHYLILVRLLRQSAIYILKEEKMEIEITSYQDAETSKCDSFAVLKELRVEMANRSIV